MNHVLTTFFAKFINKNHGVIFLTFCPPHKAKRVSFSIKMRNRWGLLATASHVNSRARNFPLLYKREDQHQRLSLFLSRGLTSSSSSSIAVASSRAIRNGFEVKVPRCWRILLPGLESFRKDG